MCSWEDLSLWGKFAGGQQMFQRETFVVRGIRYNGIGI